MFILTASMTHWA